MDIGREDVFLSIVIPAYNEEARLMESLKAIKEYLEGKDYISEVIVADDGSNDRTPDIVTDTSRDFPGLRLIRNPINMGKGEAVKRGIMEARGKYILFSDADLSTPIEEIDTLFTWIERGFDIVIGSRTLAESRIEVHQPFYREMMGRVFNLMVRSLLLLKIRDTQCGFKLFRRDVAEQIFPLQRLKGFGFDVEILYIADTLGYKIKEVPIIWRNSCISKVKPFKDSLKTFSELLQIRINSIKGRYSR